MTTATETPTVTRVVTLPVWEVSSPAGAKVIDTFRNAWRLSTDLANWCQRELALHDPGLRTPGAEKLPKYDPKCLPGGRSLYQHVTANCPFRSSFDGAAKSMSAVLKAVEDGWRNHKSFGRFAVLWKGEARPCVFRYPLPWPVPSQDLRIGQSDGGSPIVKLNLPGGRCTLRLAHNSDFRRQLRQFDTLLEDPSRLKQAKVTGRFRNGVLVGADVRLVGAFDAAEPKGGDLVAVVRTDPNALLVVEVEGRQPWILNADDIRRSHAGHKVRLQRVREDLKREKRVPCKKQKRVGAAVERWCDKHHKRMDTAIHQVTAQVAGYCDRAGVGSVAYDDAVQSYVPDGFPWAEMKSRLAYKLEAIGVEMVG